MKLPEQVRAEIEDYVGPLDAAEPVGGGCISATRRLRTARGSYFLKYDREKPPGFFAAEAAGLAELAAPATILRVPAVVATSADAASGHQWILLEWLEPGRRTPAASADLGKGLAALHRAGARRWGWHRDGFIGSLPQSNRRHGRWADFWWGERLAPQLDRARAGGYLGGSDWSRLRDRLPELLAAGEAEGPSLLHGDLWNGNVLHTDEGPALIDPAVYHGHREVDLAMAALFGGFDRTFFEAYEAAWPPQPGSEVRREVYQLYYLLVHVNLFGASYVGRTEATLRSILSTTREEAGDGDPRR